MSLLTKEDFALLELVMYIDQDVLWAARVRILRYGAALPST